MQPDELLSSTLDGLKERWPCREQQLRQLNALLSVSIIISRGHNAWTNNNKQPRLPSPPALVAYGAQATGKSNLIKSYLETTEQRHVIVQCNECVTGRHLLERTAAAVHQSLQTDAEDGDVDVYTGRCENISALVSHLQRMLQDNEKYTLVFDGIDQQREAPPTLLPALARLGEFVGDTP
jgi:origin recognition complex subunit 5